MNTERRHELESNTLARGLTDWTERLRPYTSVILGVIALLLAVYVGASLWNSHQATRNTAAWYDFQTAVFENDQELRELRRLANSEEHQGTEVQEWALVGWADRQVRLAAGMYLTNRDEAKKRLTEVSGLYEGFVESGSSPEIRNRARMGLGRVAEMQNKPAEARRHYSLVEGPLEEIAAERVKELETKDAQDAVAWLATAELPKPKPLTGPGIPGQKPGFEATPPTTDQTGGTGFSTQQSLEDILGGIAPGGEARYGAEEKAPESPAEKTGGAAEAPAADKGTTAPASDASATRADPAEKSASPSTEPSSAPAAELSAPSTGPSGEQPAAGSEQPADAAKEPPAAAPPEQK